MQMLEFVDSDIKTLITIFQIFIKFSRDMEQPEKEQRGLKPPDLKAYHL